MGDTVFNRLTQRLDTSHAAYDVLRHEPVYTSEEAARVRNTPLASGAKALVCKADENFVMFVIPASLRLASKRIRKETRLRSLRFASREEILDLTGLTPGEIPPFGSLFQMPTQCDRGLAAQTRINFNAGDHSVSISMSWDDYLRVEQPVLGEFAEPR
jgi:Ala-tRNA(Pro) deacylase